MKRARAVRKPWWRQGLDLVSLLVVLQVVFLGLLVVAAAVPDDPIVQHLATDIASGTYGVDGSPDGLGGRSTAFTDCVEAGVYLGAAPAMPLFRKAVQAPRLDSCARGSQQIEALAEGEQGVAQDSYFRYWNGYTVLTRPVMAASGVNGLRLVSGALLLGSLGTLLLVLASVTTRAYAAALLAPLVLATNLMSAPATSFSHALSNAAIFFGVAATAWAAARRPAWLVPVVAIAAACFCFVDLLTTPPLAWALSAAVAGAASRRIRPMLVAGFVWPLAFAVTWASRWIIAAVVLGPEAVRANVVGKVDERIADTGSVSSAFGAAIPENLHTWLLLPTAWPILALAVAVTCWCVTSRREPMVLAWAFPALVVPAWLALLSNHSQIHDHFVYRSVPGAVGIVVAAAVLGWQLRRDAPVVERTVVEPTLADELAQPPSRNPRPLPESATP